MKHSSLLNMHSGNPIIRHKYTADPTVIVFEDTVYLYTGHDEAGEGEHAYVMNEWLCFSSRDLTNWTEHPIDLKPTNFTWARGNAYASNVIHRDGKFYFYGSLTHASIPGEAIAVAIAHSPVGPFNDVRGSALISSNDLKHGGKNFDPSVIMDDDGQGYIFWGKEVCYYAPLRDNLMELAGPGKSITLPAFQEGCHIYKRNGWYYLSYGYEFPEKVGYAMSRSIHGPWKFKGILNEVAGNCETNRPAILEFKGQHYFFYHTGSLPGGGSHRRSVCVDQLNYNSDGTLQRVIMTSEGIHN